MNRVKAFPTWRDAISKIAPAPPKRVYVEEPIDPSTLSERIGVRPRADRPQSPDASAPWRRALRTPPAAS